MPKLTAYNCFMRDKSFFGLAFKDKVAKWNSLNDEEKQKYKDESLKNNEGVEPTVRKTKVVKEKTTKKLSAYNCFLQDKTTYANVKFGEKIKMWSGLDEKEKQKYKDIADKCNNKSVVETVQVSQKAKKESPKKKKN